MPRRSSFARDNRRLARRHRLEIAGPPIIALLSDFGLVDGYVAGMKASILTMCPRAVLVDISHDLPAFDVRSAAYVLKTVFPDFPPGTVYLAVVDPGVGSERRPLAIRTACRRTLVGPDNGLFSWILKEQPAWEARVLQEARFWKPVVSGTFHGRDLFAPVTAHVARGGTFKTLGPVCHPRMGAWVTAGKAGNDLHGEVIHVDRFGNLITNITREDLGGVSAQHQWSFELPGNLRLRHLSWTYSDRPVGSTVAVIGSSGHLEIAVNQGNAAQILALGAGSPVIAFHLHS
jgi:S-adenosyl-L-methionine hydrolase (adenosine-forming)